MQNAASREAFLLTCGLKKSSRENSNKDYRSAATTITFYMKEARLPRTQDTVKSVNMKAGYTSCDVAIAGSQRATVATIRAARMQTKVCLICPAGTTTMMKLMNILTASLPPRMNPFRRDTHQSIGPDFEESYFRRCFGFNATDAQQWDRWRIRRPKNALSSSS